MIFHMGQTCPACCHHPGNEGAGLSTDVMDQCHQLLTIESRHQLHHGVDSLNVSVATGLTYLRSSHLNIWLCAWFHLCLLGSVGL